MKLPNNIRIPENIRPRNKKTRGWVDNEIYERFGSILKPQGLAMYGVLAMHSNSKTQSCFPSYPRLMKLSGVGKRNTVSNYLQLMEKLGLIKIVRNNKRQPNIYFLLNPTYLKIDSIQKDTTQKIDNSIPKVPTQYPISNINSSERDTLNHITNPNKEINDLNVIKNLKILEESLKKSGVIVSSKTEDTFRQD